MTREEQVSSSRPPSLGGRRASIGLLFTALISLFWWHSAKHCDALAVFGPHGNIGAIACFQSDVWLVVTNIDVGEPWTAQTVSASSEDGQRLRGLLIDGGSTVRARWTPTLSTRWRFFLATQRKDAFDIPGKWCTTAGGPVWALLPIGIWPIITWLARRARLHRRVRRGWCPTCGYDLKGIANQRCPECGETNHAGT